MTDRSKLSPPCRPRQARRMMLRGCAVGAMLAGAMLAGEAGAQPFGSFQANPTVTNGLADVAVAPGQTNVTVSSPSAIILWRTVAPGDPLIFQPADTTATFTGNPGFAVLNRIIHNGRIQFDGTVLGRTGSAVPATAGTIAFYAPQGIILGSTAVFDVGSLILTTLNPFNQPDGTFIDATGAINFQADQFPAASVVTLPGSQVTALQEGSYVIMAAPRVEHGGSVLVNGSAAYVAAAGVAVRHNSGLFDIFVTSGTTVADAIVHTGRTGGPASPGGTDNHRIYMAAVSQDVAITALVSGDVGFDAPLSATVENGVIILSTYSLAPGNVPGANPANLAIEGGTYTSDVIGLSSHDASATGGATFEQDLTLTANRSVSVIGDEGPVRIGGNLILTARNPSLPVDPTGGTATIAALNGGSVEVVGDATVDAAGVSIGTLGNAVGGTAQVTADNGSVLIGGNLRVTADGLAVPGGPAPATGGSGQAGTARLATSQSGTITVGGNLDASARALSQNSSSPTIAPTATGGQVTLQTRTGAINVAGTTRLAADAASGTVSSGSGLAAGLARGGTVRIDVNQGQINLTGAATIDATALGGLGATGGSADGGDVIVQAANGSIELTAGGSANVNAQGGASSQPGGNGGSGNAGDITLAALSGTAPSSINSDDLTLTAVGRGGNGGAGQGSVQPGIGGVGTGGSVNVNAQRLNGSIQLADLVVSTRGVGGRGGGGDAGQNGGAGGNGNGGFTAFGTRAESPAISGTSSGGFRAASVDVDSAGEGGAGGTPGTGGTATGGAGGRGQGGNAFLSSQGAPTTIDGLVRLGSEGIGGAGGSGNGGVAGATGTARGGELVIAASAVGSNSGSINVGTLQGALDARGDNGTANQGGYFRIIASNSPITFGSATILNSVTGNPAARQPSDFQPSGGVITVTTSGLFQSDGDLRFSALDGGRLVGGDVSFTSNASINVTHGSRPAGQATIDVTTLSFDAAVNFTSGVGTLIRGSTSASIFVDALASIGDQLSGQTIRISSAAIEILDTGRVGDSGTDEVSLNPNASGARIGGDNVGSGYVLSAAEAGRIQSDLLRISVPAGSGPTNRPADVIVRDLTLDSTRVGALDIVTPGIVQVEGALLLSNAVAASSIRISGGDGPSQRLQVITPAGSIRVRSTAGAPAGTVAVQASDIWITDQPILTQLLANPNFTGRNEALLANSGGPNAPRGYVEGGNVTLTPLNTLFVQNSGSATDFGGITIGDGTLTINATTAAGATTDVYAFGRRVRPDGTMTVGDVFFGEVTYNGNYTAGSKLNECIIPTRTCPTPPPPPADDTPTNPTPTSTEVERPVGDPSVRLPPLEDDDDLINSFAAEPLIEEPVTSGGDSSAWTEDDDDEEEEEEEGQTSGSPAPRTPAPGGRQ